MTLKKNIIVIAGLAALVGLTYLGFGAANQSNIAQAQADASKADAAKAKSKWSTGTAVSLESEKAKLGYSFGAQIGQDIARGGMINEIEIDAFIAAIRDLATGAEPQLTGEQMQQVQQAFQLKRQQEFAALGAQNKTKGEAFLAQNKTEEGILSTESGLQYQIVREGKGKQPTAESKVKVHYLGTLIDGTPFDSSYQRNEPTEFPVTGVIPGFSEGLLLMKEGAKYRFVIPSELAYGEQGPASIGPSQVLIFEVELIEVL